MSFYKVIAGAKPTGTQWNATVLESLKFSSLNLIRELIDREVSFSADGTDFYGEAYIDANGRMNSVDTENTDGFYDINTLKYVSKNTTAFQSDTTHDPNGYTDLSNCFDQDQSTSGYIIKDDGALTTSYIGKTFPSKYIGTILIKASATSNATSSMGRFIYFYLETYDGSSWTTESTLYGSSKSYNWSHTIQEEVILNSTVQGVRLKIYSSSGDSNVTHSVYWFSYGNPDNTEIYHTIPSGTFHSNISSSYAKVMYGDWEEGASVQYKLLNSFSETTYLIVEAGSIGTYTSTYDTAIINIGSGKWIVYCTNSSVTEEEKRAKIYADLFNKDTQQVLSFNSITSIQTSITRDIGKQVHYARIYNNEWSGGMLYTGTFVDTSTNTSCSSWSDCYTEYFSGKTIYSRWEMPSGTTLHERGNVSPSGWSREIGVNTSSNELNNPTTCQLDQYWDGTSAGNEVESLILCSGDITWVETDNTSSSGGSAVKTWENISYLSDYSIPVFSTITESIGTNDSGWLDENELSTFTAFTLEPTTCIVKLIPKSSSPTAGFPSIKGISYRGA